MNTMSGPEGGEMGHTCLPSFRPHIRLNRPCLRGSSLDSKYHPDSTIKMIRKLTTLLSHFAAAGQTNIDLTNRLFFEVSDENLWRGSNLYAEQTITDAFTFATETTIPNSQPWIVIVSVVAFLLWFFIFREENDVDDIFRRTTLEAVSYGQLLSILDVGLFDFALTWFCLLCPLVDRCRTSLKKMLF